MACPGSSQVQRLTSLLWSLVPWRNSHSLTHSWTWTLVLGLPTAAVEAGSEKRNESPPKICNKEQLHLLLAGWKPSMSGDTRRQGSLCWVLLQRPLPPSETSGGEPRHRVVTLQAQLWGRRWLQSGLRISDALFRLINCVRVGLHPSEKLFIDAYFVCSKWKSNMS